MLSTIEDLDATASGLSYNYKWRGQGFPPEVLQWISSEYKEAKRTFEAEDKVASWLRTFGYTVIHDQMGLLVDGRRVSVQRRRLFEPKLIPLKGATAYILTNNDISECFVVPAATAGSWCVHLGLMDASAGVCRRHKIEIKVSILL